MGHYFVIGIIILIILIIQIKIFLSTSKKISLFKNIFSKNIKEKWTIVKSRNCGIQILSCENRRQIESQLSTLQEQIDQLQNDIDVANTEIFDNKIEYLNSKNKKKEDLVKEYNRLRNSVSVIQDSRTTIGIIINSINSYLDKNSSGISDFQLIKDIVDRNCDAKEEEIQTQIPVPLYLGLMGTMVGILVGVGYLVWSGGLNSLLNSSENVGFNGIETLLGGVALAMICSIAGIICTTIGSVKQKDAKIVEESHKHDFLSWMQAELLPKLSTDAFVAMESVTRNLSDFNDTFASNSNQLKDILEEITQSAKSQTELLETVNGLRLKKIATANIEVYDKLKSCTDEIGSLSIYLHSINDYLVQVKELTTKIDDVQERTKLIEEMAQFFKEERGQFEAIQGALIKAVGGTSFKLDEVLEDFKDNAEKQFNELEKHLTKQRVQLTSAIENQDKALEGKTKELSIIVAKLKQLPNLEKCIIDLTKANKDQSIWMEMMANTIAELAKRKGVESGSHGDNKIWDNIKKILPIVFYVLGSIACIAILIVVLMLFFKK